MSYGKKGIKNKIHKIKPRRPLYTRLWFWIVLLLVVIISSAVYFFVFYPGVQIKNIMISGNQKVSGDDIKNLISKDINHKFFGIGSWQVNSRSIFLADSNRMNRDILNKFPGIESVKIDRKFMQTLDVKINERVPVAVFCPSLDKTDNKNCYSMDNSGTIFGSLDDATQNMVIVRQPLDYAQIFVGEKIVQQNILDLILRVEKDLKDNFQIDLKDALVASPLRMNAGTSENWQIYFDLSPGSDINSQLTKLNLLLTDKISPDARKKLRYIDLRPKDRAIVCDNSTCGG